MYISTNDTHFDNPICQGQSQSQEGESLESRNKVIHLIKTCKYPNLTIQALCACLNMQTLYKHCLWAKH